MSRAGLPPEPGRLAPVRALTAPMVALAGMLLPVAWAFPAGLPFLRAAGIVVAWAGGGLLLASLLMMVREVRLAAALGGLERMTRWHHYSGMAAYLLLLLHPLLLAAEAVRVTPAGAWQLLAPGLSPGAGDVAVWLGWAALLCLMVGLAATFSAGLAWRYWRWLHALLGLGTVLGFAHVQWLGIGLGAVLGGVVAGVLLLWRLLRIDAGTAARPAVVRAVRTVAEGTVEITLAPLARSLAVLPGQFVLVAFLSGPRYRGCGEFHPFTVSGHDPDGALRIGVKALGDCTRRMQSLVSGVAARVHGPFGDFMAGRPECPQFWVAGGIGITPFLAVLREGRLTQAVRLLYLFRGGREAGWLDELQALAAADPLLTLTVRETGPRPPPVDALLPEAATLRGCACYLCGPPGLLGALEAALRARGVPAAEIHFERFDFR